MTFLDIVLAIVLGWGVFKGLRNGLFVEITTLVAFFIGIYAAIEFSSVVVLLLQPLVSWSPHTIKISAFAITFLLVIVVLYLLAKMVTQLANFAHLGFLNTLGGGVFAGIKTILLLGFVLNSLQKIDFANVIVSKELMEKSILLNPILNFSEKVLPAVRLK